MNISLVGSGINGIIADWELLNQGHSAKLSEKGEIMQKNTSVYSKLLQDGLYYLDNFEFRLVKEALKRVPMVYIDQAPHIAQPLKLCIPIYQKNRRPTWMYKDDLWSYNQLAEKQNIDKYQSLIQDQIKKTCPELKTENPIKGFSFYGVQMGGYQLDLWELKQVKKKSELIIKAHAEEKKANEEVNLALAGGTTQTFNEIINIASPWVEQLLKKSNIKPKYNLDLVRESHILVGQQIQHGYCLETSKKRHIFFVLLYQGKALFSTTEEHQSINEDIKPSEQKKECLINVYKHYFKTPISKLDIVQSFPGLRLLIKSANKSNHEYVIQQNQNVISIFADKWTTARQFELKAAVLVK